MGIKGLNQFLKRIFDDESIYSLVPLQNYACKKIAIDAPLLICMFKMRDNTYEESFIEFISNFRQLNIHPIFVFDGECPGEKIKQRQLRAEKKMKQYQRVDTLEAELTDYKKTKTVGPALRELNMACPLAPGKINLKAVEAHIKKLRSQILHITEHDFTVLKQILDLFRVSYITAEGEGEILCAQLCKQGLVSAVYTRDTDVLAACAPVMLSSITADGYFLETRFEKILQKTGLTDKQWVDFCIMCGTDFNDNIPKIGPCKSFELIKKFESIEEISKLYDVSPLNYEVTRTLFNVDDYTEKVHACGSVDFDKIADWIVTRGLKISPSKIKRQCLKPVIKVNY